MEHEHILSGPISELAAFIIPEEPWKEGETSFNLLLPLGQIKPWLLRQMPPIGSPGHDEWLREKEELMDEDMKIPMLRIVLNREQYEYIQKHRK